MLLHSNYMNIHEFSKTPKFFSFVRGGIVHVTQTESSCGGVTLRARGWTKKKPAIPTISWGRTRNRLRYAVVEEFSAETTMEALENIGKWMKKEFEIKRPFFRTWESRHN